MLNIFFGDMPEAIYNTEVYFQNVYDDDWLKDDFAARVIKKVDRSEVLDAQAIKSPVLGIIAPERLSGGTKTLLLIKNMPDKVFNASTCGDNCARFILEIAKDREVTIESKKSCHVLKGKNWFEDLERISDSLVFIDEGNAFIHTVEFARALQNTDNYYVFVTRENLYQLPYSVNSILELKKTTSRFKHTYNRTYPRYDCIRDLKDRLEPAIHKKEIIKKLPYR